MMSLYNTSNHYLLIDRFTKKIVLTDKRLKLCQAE